MLELLPPYIILITINQFCFIPIPLFADDAALLNNPKAVHRSI